MFVSGRPGNASVEDNTVEQIGIDMQKYNSANAVNLIGKAEWHTPVIEVQATRHIVNIATGEISSNIEHIEQPMYNRAVLVVLN